MSKPAIKRRRVINSCLHCREKKLKCDKQKPICGTCIKTGHVPCAYSAEYSSAATPASNEGSPPNEVMDIHRGSTFISKEGPLSYVSLINLDPFITNLLYSMKDLKKNQLKIQEEVTNKRVDNIVPAANSKDLFKQIKPFITNTEMVWFLVNHFFDTEIYHSCSFISKESFKSSLINYIGPESFPAVRYMIETPFDHLFLGSLLVIMRISSVSFYNCGYPTQLNHKTIGPEVIQLAKRCYELIKPQYHSFRLEMLQLLLLMNFYKINAPEEIDIVESHESSGIALYAYRMAMSLGLHLECKTEHLRRLWYHILQLDTDQFVRDGGTDYFIKEESYTTSLPKDEDVSDKVMVERFEVRSLLKFIASRITNVREELTVTIMESLIRPLEVYLEDITLDSIFEIKEKPLKTVRFLNFLDISSVVFMISYHIVLHLVKVDSDRAISKMLGLLTLSNKVIPITQFFDSSKEQKFNLQEQFGYNFSVITKILSTLHKFLQLQISFTGRVDFVLAHNVSNKELDFKEMKRIAYQNSKLIIKNFGKIDSEYFYAKRMNRIQSLVFYNCFGTSHESQISQTYLNLLENEPRIIYSKVHDKLIELSQPENDYQEQTISMLNDSTSELFNLVLDQSMIEELGKLIDTESFLPSVSSFNS